MTFYDTDSKSLCPSVCGVELVISGPSGKWVLLLRPTGLHKTHRCTDHLGDESYKKSRQLNVLY